jgi:prepilin-type N-terminal cleavage/methylation domain-containing protein/prepilin-type processing-associated H-X9-DG protein
MKTVKVLHQRAFTLIELLVVIAIVALLASLLLPAMSRAKAMAQLIRCKGNLQQMGLAMSLYADDFDYFAPNSWDYDGQRTPRFDFWFDFIKPYTSHDWTDPLYNCPGFRVQKPRPVNEFERNASIIYGDYGHNTSGVTTIREGLGLGKDILAVGVFAFVKESSVRVPHDMIGLGDGYSNSADGSNLIMGLSFMPGWRSGNMEQHMRARELTRRRHTGAFNIWFVDGHIEHLKPGKLFGKRADELKRWNRDNQAPQELPNNWQQPIRN